MPVTGCNSRQEPDTSEGIWWGTGPWNFLDMYYSQTLTNLSLEWYSFHVEKYKLKHRNDNFVKIRYILVLFKKYLLYMQGLLKQVRFKGTVHTLDGSGRKYVQSKGLLKWNLTTSNSCWLIGNKLPTAHTALSVAFYSLNTAVGNSAMNKFGICFQWRNENLRPKMVVFSEGNCAINALWNWEQHNECSSMLTTVQWDQCEYTRFFLYALCIMYHCKYTLVHNLPIQV